MILKKAEILSSSYLGIYSFCTDDYCIVPSNILDKEKKFIEKNLDVKVIKTSINQSPLIGVYLTGLKNKLVIGDQDIQSKELEVLEKEGIKTKVIKDYSALGNLISLNSNFGISSSLLNKKTVNEISTFLNIDISQKRLSGLDLAGSLMYVNDQLLVVNPNIQKEEFDYLKNNFKVPAVATTLNYGDSFVGNDIISNKNGILVGKITSNIEILSIDDILV